MLRLRASVAEKYNNIHTSAAAIFGFLRPSLSNVVYLVGSHMGWGRTEMIVIVWTIIR